MNDHGRRVYDSILGLLSSEENPTPIVRLNRVVAPHKAAIYGKLEWYNPFGAVKDRIAANLVRDAEEKGVLKAGRKLVEPTSGNTGLGLAMIANAKGYPLRTPLSQAIPLEKRAILRFFGSDVVELDDTLCPAPGAPEGAIAMAMNTAKTEPGFHMLNQYENEANPDAHYRTTGPEIWRQTQGKVTHFVAGLGTCGTITGTGRFLKEQNPKIKVIGVHPNEGHDIPGVRSIRQLKQTRFYRPKDYDATVEIKSDDAYAMCLRLNREESIIAGPSSAMALLGALKAVEDAPDAVVVVIFPDNVFKYASSLQRHLPKLFTGMKGAAEAPAPEAPPAPSGPVPPTIDIDEIREMMAKGQPPVFVDVRSPGQYQEIRVAGSINVPMQELRGKPSGLPPDHSAPIVAICNRGHTSQAGAAALRALGYTNARSMNGGLAEWFELGLPVER